MTGSSNAPFLNGVIGLVLCHEACIIVLYCSTMKLFRVYGWHTVSNVLTVTTWVYGMFGWLNAQPENTTFPYLFLFLFLGFVFCNIFSRPCRRLVGVSWIRSSMIASFIWWPTPPSWTRNSLTFWLWSWMSMKMRIPRTCLPMFIPRSGQQCTRPLVSWRGWLLSWFQRFLGRKTDIDIHFNTSRSKQILLTGPSKLTKLLTVVDQCWLVARL